MRRSLAAVLALGLCAAGVSAGAQDLVRHGSITRDTLVLTPAGVTNLVSSATPSAPTWNTAAVGANPTVALAVSANTAYKRTGTGTLTLSAVTGLSADPTYCIFSGFGSLVLPPGFAVAGSGSFRSGKENHLAFWSTPTTNVVNFLFAQ